MTKIRIEVAELKRLQAKENDLYETRIAASYAEEALLNNVIDALGLRGTYHDEVQERERRLPVYTPNRYGGRDISYETVRALETVSVGTSRFKADVLEAADAAKGADALKRLRSAMKEARS